LRPKLPDGCHQVEGKADRMGLEASRVDEANQRGSEVRLRGFSVNEIFIKLNTWFQLFPASLILRIDTVAVDLVLPLKAISEKIVELTGKPAGRPPAVPEEIMEEIKISEHQVPDLDEMEKLGRITPYTCPECGGVLWRMKNLPYRAFFFHPELSRRAVRCHRVFALVGDPASR